MHDLAGGAVALPFAGHRMEDWEDGPRASISLNDNYRCQKKISFLLVRRHNVVLVSCYSSAVGNRAK